MPQVPYKAPSISGLDSAAVSLQPGAFDGRYVVLFFYPKAMTSGCTVEAQNFQEHLEAFHALDAVIIAVSKDPCAAIGKFEAKEGLKYLLLSDEKGDLCERFGVWTEKSMYGRKYMGIERSTFLIDPKGNVVKEWRKVKVPGHAAEVLASLGALQRS
jgi:thioredoxin-dependent peroxiredoxin